MICVLIINDIVSNAFPDVRLRQSLTANSMKGTKVPNPLRLSYACHAHSVLFLPTQSLLTSF